MQYDDMDRAKARLVASHPFFATLLLSMPMSKSGRTRTMATDGKQLFYNEGWVKTLQVEELVFVFAHEVMHCVFHHMYRLNSREKLRWNIACDFAINRILIEDNVGTMPEGALDDKELYEEAGGLADKIYDLIRVEQVKECGEKGGSLDEMLEPGGSEAEREADQAETRVRVSQAYEAAKVMGKASANLKRLVNDLLKPKVDWRSVLRNFLVTRAKVDWSYAKPKRRFLAEDIYLPSLNGVQIGKIVVAVDCSGSIDDKTLQRFATELRSICQDVLPTEVQVMYFDSEVLRTDVFPQGETPEINPVGGGGTAFSPIFKEIEKKDIDPVACIVLTDLQCSDFGAHPGYAVMWATTDSMVAPWGEVLRIGE